LYYKKLKAAGFTSMQDAILQDGVYVVSKTVNEVEWLKDYYLEKGINVEVSKIDSVSDAFIIYKFNEVD
jgi:hypothetical protein